MIRRMLRLILLSVLSFGLMKLYFGDYLHFDAISIDKQELKANRRKLIKVKSKSKISFMILLHTKYFGRKWTEKYPIGETKCNLPSSYSQCVYTDKNQQIHSSHAVLFHGNDLLPPRDMLRIPRNPHQIWIFMTQENPLTTNTGVYRIKDYNNLFNWTATYHHTAHVVTPYYDVINIDNKEPSLSLKNPTWMKLKKKVVVGIMSNCVEYRIEFIKKLKRYVEVDLYGKCKNKVNPEISEQCDQHSEECDKLQKSYKFFLAIENFYCTDYVTEKFYNEALQKGLVPIVLNGGKMGQAKVAPPGSFIDVLDFKDLHHLGAYIKYLDGNDTAYLQYHQWRRDYEVVVHDYKCNLCRILNKKFSNVRRWPALKLGDKWNEGMCKRFSDDMFQNYLK